MSKPISITAAQLDELEAHGLTINAAGEVVEVKRANPVLRVIKEGASDGAAIGETVAKTTGRGIAKVGSEAIFIVVDVPTVGIKALGRALRRGHVNRVQSRRQRKLAKANATLAAAQAEANTLAETNEA